MTINNFYTRLSAAVWRCKAGTGREVYLIFLSQFLPSTDVVWDPWHVWQTPCRQRVCSSLGCSKIKLSQSSVKPEWVWRAENQEHTLHIPGWKTSLWALTLTSGVSSMTASPSDICPAFLQAKSVCLSLLVSPCSSNSEGLQHPDVCTSDRMGVPGMAWEFLSSHWPSGRALQLNTLLTSHWAAQKQIS